MLLESFDNITGTINCFSPLEYTPNSPPRLKEEMELQSQAFAGVPEFCDSEAAGVTVFCPIVATGVTSFCGGVVVHPVINTAATSDITTRKSSCFIHRGSPGRRYEYR